MQYLPQLYQSLKILYENKELANSFDDDNAYLKSAFIETEKLWEQNFSQLTRIKFIIIGEAPLWGDKKNYIYNPDKYNTQFFTKNDLGKQLGISINDKVEFMQQCIQIGLVFIDTFPFALNKKITKLNFQTMNEYQYRFLFENTTDNFFLKKFKKLSTKCTNKTKIAFRYSRTRKYLSELIEMQLLHFNITQLQKMPIISLSKQGGQINKVIFSKFLIE